MISISEAEKLVELLNGFLREGDFPDGHKCSGHERLASASAAKKMGVHRSVIARKLAQAKTEHGLEPNWGICTEKEEAEVDHISVRRLKDKLAKAETRAAKAERSSISSEAIREGILGLAATPLEPRAWEPSKDNKKGHKEALVLFVSDVHMGEFICKEQMGGRNSFDKKICGKRLERLFQGVVKMGTVH